MADNVDALRAGEVDVVQLYEPYVEMLVAEGAGHVWHAGTSQGPTAYTTFCTTSRMIRSQPDTLLALTRAMARTLKWYHAHSGGTVARLVGDYFPDLPNSVLSAAISRYKRGDLWGHHTLVAQVGFERLKRSFLSGGQIRRGTPYQGCVHDPVR